MKILYYDNCWFTNVGEAFIDMGAMQLIRNVMVKDNDFHLGTLSTMTQWYMTNAKDLRRGLKNEVFGKLRKELPLDYNKSFWAHRVVSSDCFIAAGMWATKAFKDSNLMKILIDMKSKGSKIILLGVGGLEYNEEEREIFISCMQQVQPSMVITRDKRTYEMYQEYMPCYPGIDCALWVEEIFNPTGFQACDYVISTFNYIKEPEELQCKEYIRPWHMQYSLHRNHEALQRDNVMYSDSPYDYLTLYANAQKVYTDLVHATLICLMYGTPVKYYYFDKRCSAFEDLKGLNRDNDGFMTLTKSELELQKKQVEGVLTNVIFGDK